MRQLLAAFKDFTIAGECRDGREVLSVLNTLKPDVIFLDVQMPEIDGFEVIRRRTPERMPAIVFLTAYDQFAIRAFEAEALDYLLKPVSEERFAATIKRLTQRLRSGARREPGVIVSTPRGVMVLHAHEIDWIEAAGNYVQLHVAGATHLLRETMTWLEEQLPAQKFLRVSRSAMVNLDRVKELQALFYGDFAVILRDGTKVTMSRNYRERLTKFLTRSC